MLQINEEERNAEKRKKMSIDTYQSIKRNDDSIIDITRKRRGRKKFILIDSQVKANLKKRDLKYLERIKLLT